jgi:hypothetical protein
MRAGIEKARAQMAIKHRLELEMMDALEALARNYAKNNNICEMEKFEVYQIIAAVTKNAFNTGTRTKIFTDQIKDLNNSVK